MKYLLFIICIALLPSSSGAQTFVFAQLKGTPVNTTGWTLTGAATVGNILGLGNSEIILCRNQNDQSGAIFYNEPINLSMCNKWVAEFDMRMNDGSQADGIAFCFLDVPPSGFVTGGGLGIPASAQGLKVCFDTYLNCPSTGSLMPKIELRWGAGYDECGNLPTVQNSGGELSVIRSSNYCHAKIVYNGGNIEVYINNTLFLTGFQQFNFSGYLGFTASTGGLTDNHSIKNVVIYTDMPPSEAGPDQTVCSGQPYQLGTTANPDYIYKWTPAQGLSNASASDPTGSLVNNSGGNMVTKYYVNTAFANNSVCASRDSVSVTVLPTPGITITTPSASVCKGDIANFTATVTGGGASPVLQWKLNGVNAGTNSTSFSSSALKTGDVIVCEATGDGSCPKGTSNSIVMTVNPVVVPAVSISASANNVCAEVPVSFTAIPVNGGATPSYQWTVNGVAAGTNAPTFTSTSLGNNDLVQCTLTSGSSCPVPATVSSAAITMSITPLVTPAISITASAGGVCTGTAVKFTATYSNGGTTPVFQWKKNGVDVGSDSIGYTDGTLLNGDIINCTLASDIKCVTNSTAVSNDIAINVFTNPVLSLHFDSSLCVGSSILDAGSFSSYLWNTGSTERTITVGTVGTYSVTVTTTEGCVGSDSAKIKSILTSPADFLPADSAVCAYSRFTLAPRGDFTSYLWSTNATTSQIEIRQPGTYWLQVTNSQRCVGKDSVVFNVKDCGNEIFYPTAFTPNGDGMNDVFKPLLLNKVDHYKFSVYNRWGQLLFSSTDPSHGWDGLVKGTKQDTQVFVWTCTYQFDQQPLKMDRGTIVLIR